MIPITPGNLALEPCLFFEVAPTCYRIFSVYKGIVVTLMGSEPRRGLLRWVRAGKLQSNVAWRAKVARTFPGNLALELCYSCSGL